MIYSYRWSHYGIEHPKYCWISRTTVQLIYGARPVLLRNYFRDVPYSRDHPNVINWKRFLRKLKIEITTLRKKQVIGKLYFHHNNCFFNSLIGTPHSSQWPTDISILRDHFPHRPRLRPIDLCPELDEYANDLLSVCIMQTLNEFHYNELYSFSLKFYFILANVGIWSMLSTACHRMFESHVFYARTNLIDCDFF